MNYKEITAAYNFECTLCANCCTGDTQILLDFFDLYKLGRFLNFSHSAELFKYNYVFLVQTENDVWRPQLRFKTKPFSFCPFLMHRIDNNNKISGLCQLHPNNKPLVCVTAPIGRRYDIQASSIEYIYHPPAPDCPGIRSQKLNHIRDLEEELEKEFYYQQITYRILENIRSKNLSKEKTQELFSFPLNRSFDLTINLIIEKSGDIR